ncbi:MAG: hypothetical protein JJ847_07395 [Prochlorococcus marinus CUG1438]|nr:hypothetical protein [Prochlorococcus marinus CUG1438]
MLFPIKSNQITKLIPAVGTGSQFKYTLGNPRKILQRFIISSIGGFVSLIISSTGDQTNNFWLLLCVAFFLYIIWGPILESSRKNLRIRKYKFFSIFDGYVSDIYKTEKIESSREQSNMQGRLEVIENKRTWLVLELEDEDGYLEKLSFPMENKHSLIRVGSKIRCLLTSNNSNFDRDFYLTDAWLPEINLWVGEYPYLLRPAFEEICYIYIK